MPELVVQEDYVFKSLNASISLASHFQETSLRSNVFNGAAMVAIFGNKFGIVVDHTKERSQLMGILWFWSF